MVLTLLNRFFPNVSQKRDAQKLYIALVHQSRNPFFYTKCGVADTLDGRFDIILLHVFLALHHFKLDPNTVKPAMSRFLQEWMFDDMDRSLREMGVGDMGISKRIKTMSKASFGRLEAYEKAFADDQDLQEALTRNIYRGNIIEPLMIDALVKYIRNYTLPSFNNP
jgi:cytochrome b pre-mRNA-processing protein 3